VTRKSLEWFGTAGPKRCIDIDEVAEYPCKNAFKFQK
jgi:hypothetical protein